MSPFTYHWLIVGRRWLVAVAVLVVLLVAFLWFRSGLGIASALPSGKPGAWEYKVELLDFSPAGGGRVLPPRAEEQVRKLAAEGWEYAGFSCHQPPDRNPFGVGYPCSYALFKRAKR